jgi:hypothetical protein
LTIGDFAAFAQWAEDQAIAKVEKRAALLGSSAEERQAELKRVFAESDATTLEARAMMSMDGIRQMGWLSLHHAHPDMTVEKAGNLVTFAGVKEFQERLDRLSGLEPDPNAGSQPGNVSAGEDSSES